MNLFFWNDMLQKERRRNTMKVLILVFSPGGNTLKVARMIENVFQKRD